MFLQAGFNPRRRGLRVFALVARKHWVRPAQLIVFRSGDFAWEGRLGISWPEQIVFANLIHSPVWPYDLPQSALSSASPRNRG